MGSLPKNRRMGPARSAVSDLDLSAAEGITGWSFDQVGGTFIGTKPAFNTSRRDPATEPLATFYGAVVSPEFQYVH